MSPDQVERTSYNTIQFGEAYRKVGYMKITGMPVAARFISRWLWRDEGKVMNLIKVA